MGFGKHGKLKNGPTKHKEVLRELEYLLLEDNIYEKQNYAIKAKEEKIRLFKLSKRTDKNPSPSSDYKKIKKIVKEQGSNKRVGSMKESLNYNAQVITSARHTASVLGMSQQKANKLLNSMPNHKRKIIVQWVDGISFEKLESLKEQFPKATIYPMVSKNKIKICFGSSLILKYIRKEVSM